jgi:hypothetical protein
MWMLINCSIWLTSISLLEPEPDSTENLNLEAKDKALGQVFEIDFLEKGRWGLKQIVEIFSELFFYYE